MPSISGPPQRSGFRPDHMTNGCSTHAAEKDALEPLAIVGFALEYPQDANTPEGFWRVLKERRDVMTEWPSDRLNLDAFFYRDESQKQQKLAAGAHFLTEDLGAFDASFFEISATEAMAMDIQQRKLLEITYHAFENAGIPMDTFYGSKTGVYSGSMSDDYQQILAKDIDCIPKYSASGCAKTMVANRLSWFYDFHGPSICMDSACSSSLMAFDFACQGLRNKDCNMAVVTGSSLVFSPDGTLSLMNMNFLSPRGRCHSFDDRADGYSRGEGFGVVIVKRLSDALRDGDTIRAVVRSNGSNQDGHTQGVTQPSRQMQAALIRDTYTKAGLDFAATRFFEAHGTGTPLGDPIEADAIGSVFRTARSREEPLYVGALKSNVGHLEGGSGIAAVIKTVMVLEKGIIPPNANFENLNPRIDADFLNLKFPTENTPWPCSGLRRASIASFGFGGSNSHVVLDDAYNYLASRGLEGIHSTIPNPPTLSHTQTGHISHNGSMMNGHSNGSASSRNGSSTNTVTGRGLANGKHASTNGTEITSINGKHGVPRVEGPQERLVVLSAADEQGIRRLAEAYESHFKKLEGARSETTLDDLCYTLCARRSSLPWKSYAVVDSLGALKTLGSILSNPVSSRRNAKNAFVFTGQGAQYRNMGRSLISHPAFRATIERFDEELARLGCTWSVSDVLERPDTPLDINNPEVSQTSTTALQMALYDLLQDLGVQASMVVGHSSGEIAAAYASGALSLRSACKVSYSRGTWASSLKSSRAETPGAMMSVDLPEAEMRRAIKLFIARHPSPSMPYIACINSPQNVTVSGDEASIDALQVTLDADKVRTRKLKTGVAYHSPHMGAIAEEYATDLSHLEMAEPAGGTNRRPVMVSSVSGEHVRDIQGVCTADYWVANLLSPVQFSKAMAAVSSEMDKKRTRRLGEPKLDVRDVVEVGPHSALRRPVLDCLEHHGVAQARSRYHSALSRGGPAVPSVLNLVGELYAIGYPVNVQGANEMGTRGPGALRLLTDLPYYPFNHSKTYWHEPAISRNARLRNGAAIHELLGVPVPDWNPLEPRWRKFFDLSEMPWVGHHQVNGRVIYPAAGMVSMALQGAQQVADRGRRIAAYQVRDAAFTAPISIGKADRSEVQLHMRLDPSHTDQHATSLDFRVYSMGETGWFQNCSGSVQVLYQKDDENSSNSATLQREEVFYQRKYAEALQRSTVKVPAEKMYDQFRSNGLQYGPAFQPLGDLAWDGGNGAVGTIKCFRWDGEYSQHDRQPHIVHPTVLDGAGQLPWVSLTAGAERVVVNGAAVTRIRHAWVAGSGQSYPESSHLNACCTTSFRGLRGTDSSIFALDAAGRVVLRVSGMETTAVGGDETGSLVHSPRKICYEMSYRPDLDLLDPGELHHLVNAGLQTDPPPVSFYQDLELALFYFVTRALKTIELLNIRDTDMEPCIAKYVSWLRRQMTRYHSGDLPHSQPDWITRAQDDRAMEALLDRLAATDPEGEFLITVGRNLVPIIRGEADPLAVMFESGLARRHYEAVCDRSACCAQLKNYLAALSHKDPQLRVLEVGAGTGSITGHVLGGLAGRFARYDYTDISGAFFEQARERFAGAGAVEYRVLDIEVDAAAQGFEPHSYDVVVAAWVLHATRDLAATVANVRGLLRPGGKLVLLEITEPGLLRNGFAFGTLPGWWLSTEAERGWGPCLTEGRWADVLVGNGFQGVDLVLPDYDSEVCHENSILIATAGEDVAMGGMSDGAPTEFTFVVAPGSSFQRDVASELRGHIEGQGHGSCSTVSIDDRGLVNCTHTVMIILAELGQPFLSKLDPSSFSLLQEILGKARRVLWATSSAVSSSSFPEVQMVLGLARVLFVERPGLSFVTLNFSSPAFDTELFVRCIGRVMSETVAKESLAGRDLEYVERDGTVLINRVRDCDEINDEVHGKTHTMVRRQPISQSPPLALSIPSSGLLDSVRWEEDPRYHTDLGPDEIEIEVHAVGVNFRDLLVALGKYSAGTVGCECAGVVTRVGEDCDDTLRPGDRVCACLIGCANTHARCHYQLAVKIPDFLTTAEAASLPCTGVTAYHSLVTLAGLSAGESVLIHSATGGTGQMAVQIAQAAGAEVFVTVGNEDKRALVRELYGLADDHVLNSRDAGGFARDIYCATGGRGVDVVLNSLSGDSLLASWECVAPFGRFVELGKMDIEGNSRLPMERFSKNVTFHAVAVDHLASQRPQAVGRALRAVLDMIGEGSMRVASPLRLYPVSELEDAFRFMQSGKNTGKMVLTFSPSDVVPTWLRPKYSCSLDRHVTYLIAGGLGGLGRSAARWMAGRGARNLILLSRSGPRTTAARALLHEMKEAGVTVRTPRCDVSDLSSLASALAACADMPPIKGCLQATMVLQDALFESMTWDQWSTSIRSKVNSTWNLHRQLPPGLTFFVMLSSVAGVAGSMGQSNYAAGNTFQDGLAAHRLALGERAVSIDLGWMGDVGAVAESAALTRGKEDAGDLAPVYEAEFLALLDRYCEPEALGPGPDLTPEKAQPVIGLVTPAQFRNKGLQPPDWLVDRPLFRGLAQESDGPDGSAENGAAADGARDDRDWVAELLRAGSPGAEAAGVVADALVQRLSKATSIPPAEIDRARPLHAYGVDSLLAVELRNWFGKLFRADVAIFDITGQASLDKVAEGAAASSALLKKG